MPIRRGSMDGLSSVTLALRLGVLCAAPMMRTALLSPRRLTALRRALTWSSPSSLGLVAAVESRCVDAFMSGRMASRVNGDIIRFHGLARMSFLGLSAIAASMDVLRPGSPERDLPTITRALLDDL